ncbi:MAG: HTTM domain-containing protein [Bacteroidia bacterium]|nr:HTTM domain-containing protein [Bacteroidia bacterium]
MISKALSYLFDDYQKKTNILFFKHTLYAYVVIRCVVWLFNYNLLFCEPTISLLNFVPINPLDYPAYFLYFSSNSFLPLLCIVSSIIISLLSIVKKSTLVTDLILYLLVINIHYKLYTALTGGDAILNNLLFLGAFARTKFISSNSFYHLLLKLLHNFSVIALMFQVCIVYFYSAMVKWLDHDWLNGSAMYYISEIKHFSNGMLAGTSVPSALSFILSYLVLLYQSFFPFFIFMKKYKNLFLACGIIMHLYISVTMGLLFFGLLMICTYFLFFDFKKVHIHN